MNNEQTHDEKISKLQEVRKILPETIEKTEYYKDVLVSESELLNLLIGRQNKWYIPKLKKVRESIEILSIKNSLYSKKKIYESYLSRKKSYESFIEDMTNEINEKFDDILEEAKSIKTNVRLLQTLKKWDEDENKDDVQNKIDFYMYLKTEIRNKKKYSKR